MHPHTGALHLKYKSLTPLDEIENVNILRQIYDMAVSFIDQVIHPSAVSPPGYQ